MDTVDGRVDHKCFVRWIDSVQPFVHKDSVKQREGLARVSTFLAQPIERRVSIMQTPKPLRDGDVRNAGGVRSRIFHYDQAMRYVWRVIRPKQNNARTFRMANLRKLCNSLFRLHQCVMTKRTE
jgi:hypothetical protein